MHAKLTLSVDEDVIAQAKVFAKKQGKSLSAIIENYLKLMTHSEPKKDEKPLSGSLKKLAGSLKVPDDFDYKEVITQALMEKYMK